MSIKEIEIAPGISTQVYNWNDKEYCVFCQASIPFVLFYAVNLKTKDIVSYTYFKTGLKFFLQGEWDEMERIKKIGLKRLRYNVIRKEKRNA